MLVSLVLEGGQRNRGWMGGRGIEKGDGQFSHQGRTNHPSHKCRDRFCRLPWENQVTSLSNNGSKNHVTCKLILCLQFQNQ